MAPHALGDTHRSLLFFSRNMSKNRYINTKFWDDSYITKLDPIAKLLFLYCLTNPLTNICGIYEITIKRIAFDTEIDEKIIMEILEEFEKAGKMKYQNEWLAIKNFTKHQKKSINPKDKINIGIKKAMNEAPEHMKAWVLSPFKPLQAPSRPLKPPPKEKDTPSRNLNYSNININRNKNSNTSCDSPESHFSEPPSFPVKKEDPENWKYIESLFIEKQEYDDWGKQRNHVKKLDKRIRTTYKARAPDMTLREFTEQCIGYFWYLSCNGNSFWKQQKNCFFPSTLNSERIWTMFLGEIKKRKQPTVEDYLEGIE